MYALIEGGVVGQYPFTQSDLQAKYPAASVPVNWSLEFMASEGIVHVVVKGRPEFNPASEDIRELTPVFNPERGTWEQSFEVYQVPAEVAQERLDARWADVRAERNGLLTISDWTQVADAPVDKAAWAVYRQALRDITDQADPYSIDWPKEP